MFTLTLGSVYTEKTESSKCGSNSVVECLVANEDVAGSNPVSRSILNFDIFWGFLINFEAKVGSNVTI